MIEVYGLPKSGKDKMLTCNVTELTGGSLFVEHKKAWSLSRSKTGRGMRVLLVEECHIDMR